MLKGLLSASSLPLLAVSIAAGGCGAEEAAPATPLFAKIQAYFVDFHEKAGQSAVIDGFIADGIAYHMPGGKKADAAGVKAAATGLRDGLTDVKVTLELIAETADSVDFKMTYEGKKKESGEAFKSGPTPVRYTFSDGKVVEGWLGGEIPGFEG